MKQLLFILLLVPLLANAQSEKDSIKFLKDTLALANLPVDSTGIITYKMVEAAPGVNKLDLYRRSKVWTALAFNSAKNVTQLDDQDGGNIIIKAITEQSTTYKFWGTEYSIGYYLHFSIQITLKDNKYRIIISNFSVETKPTLQTVSTSYALESQYSLLRQWNINTKSGNMDFNRDEGIGSKKRVKPLFETINNLDSFARSTLNDAKAALSKPAKSDDF